MRSALLLTTITAVSLALAACGGDTNTNTKNANTNANINRAQPLPASTIDRTNGNISREQYDKNRAEYEKDKGASTIGQGLDDSWIWFKTRAALTTTSDLHESTINVDVSNAVITLKGTVPTAAQKASAEKIAKGIEGQKGVKNELQVKPNDSAVNQMVNGNSKPANIKK